MITPPIPENDPARVAALESLGLDDFEEVDTIRDLLAMAAQRAGTPMAIASLVGENEQTFLARIGLDADGTSRDVSFCGHTIAQNTPLYIEDAAADGRFHDNPLVTGVPHIRAYHGTPLRVETEAETYAVGTMCVLDTRPRVISDAVQAELETIAGAIQAILQARRDARAMEAAYADARWAADHCTMTGCLKGEAFRRHMESVLGGRDHEDMHVNLFLVDLDHFKTINDRYGHAFGDHYLKAFATALRESSARAESQVAQAARLGGDEFALVMPAGNSLSWRETVDFLRARISEHMTRLSVPDLGGCSIGVACSSQIHRRHSYDELHQLADIALYAAKDTGRNRTVVYDESLGQRYNMRAFRAHIEDAIETGALRPYYLPCVDLRTGTHVGFEILARWIDDRGQVQRPEIFDQAFSDRMLAPKITRAILGQALEDARGWVTAGLSPGAGALNVTTYDLSDPAFVAEMTGMVQQSGLDPHQMIIEVKETMVGEDNTDQLRQTLDGLRRTGLRVSLDNFGTGFGSLRHLSGWPIDILKIDRSFIQRMKESHADTEIVWTIVMLSHALGFTVCAEGVEDAEVADRLTHMGCHLGQGYLHSTPMSATEMAAWLRRDETLRAMHTELGNGDAARLTG